MQTRRLAPSRQVVLESELVPLSPPTTESSRAVVPSFVPGITLRSLPLARSGIQGGQKRNTWIQHRSFHTPFCGLSDLLATSLRQLATTIRCFSPKRPFQSVIRAIVQCWLAIGVGNAQLLSHSNGSLPQRREQSVFLAFLLSHRIHTPSFQRPPVRSL